MGLRNRSMANLNLMLCLSCSCTSLVVLVVRKIEFQAFTSKLCRQPKHHYYRPGQFTTQGGMSFKSSILSAPAGRRRRRQ